MPNFFYQHSLAGVGKKFGISTEQISKIASYAAAVGGFSDAKVVKILWAAKSPSVKELLRYLDKIPNPPEDADELDPFQPSHDERKAVIHSPQNEPAGSSLGLFSIPSGESTPTTKLE